MTKRSILSGVALGAMLLLSGAAFADDMAAAMPDKMATGFNTVDGIALHGFDPVAYFLQHKPVKGSPKFSASHDGVAYEFASAADMAAFQKDPAKYVPAYNGFCTTAVSEGVKADIDPHAYVIDHGRLNVFFSDEARDVFVKDRAGVAKKAAVNWPTVEKLEKIYR